MKKFMLTQEENRFGNRRIRALKDFSNVKAGDLGGFVESEDNLSHEGDCWIYDGAMVTNRARVSGNARISGNAWVDDNAQVYGNSRIGNCARVGDNAHISGQAHVYDHARIFGHVFVYEFSKIGGKAFVGGHSWFNGNAFLEDEIEIFSGKFAKRADGFSSERDSRGYTFLAVWENKKIFYVSAGCRSWNSMEEAREHYLIDYKSDGDVKECLYILGRLENAAYKTNLKKLLVNFFR